MKTEFTKHCFLRWETDLPKHSEVKHVESGDGSVKFQM